MELLLDACWCLYGHHVLDLVGLDLPPCLLDLDWQLQFDLLGNRATLLLCLDLGLDLSSNVGWQSREQLDRLLEAWNGDKLMPDRRLDLKLRLCLNLSLTLGLELDLELSLDLGLDLKLLLYLRQLLRLDLKLGLGLDLGLL